MGLLNPVYALIVPFLFIFTIPLAIFAGITTTLAFTVLIFRVLIVYLDLALAVIPQYFIGRRPRHLQYVSKSPSMASLRSSPILGPSSSSSSRRRRRRPSSASIGSVGTITPVSESGMGLMPSVGMDRDFEGVGGWRLGDDEVWTTINSRLELPDRQHNRHHHRSSSGGFAGVAMMSGGVLENSGLLRAGRNRSPETKITAVSPNSSRVRTPTNLPVAFTTINSEDGYFPVMLSPRSMRKPPSSIA
jgi:hypothetical protein